MRLARAASQQKAEHPEDVRCMAATTHTDQYYCHQWQLEPTHVAHTKQLNTCKIELS